MIGLIFLILALADTVGHINGPTKAPEQCSCHDWYQVVDTEGKDLHLICIKCSKTPAMISEEHGSDE